MGIYEQFMRFVKMLNYDTNVEIKFIIISHAMRGFCEIWGHLNHLQRVSFPRHFRARIFQIFPGDMPRTYWWVR